MKRIIAVVISVCCTIAFMCSCVQQEEKVGLGNGFEPVDSMELEYANQFSVDYYDGGYKLITLPDGSRFLTVPEEAELPEGISDDIVPLYQPIDNIYLAATSAMCLFDALDRLDAIKLSGTRQDGWYIDNAVKAMQNGDILYAGKYNEPDYEIILDNSCRLAVESTMIGHASDVKKKLESLGIAVLIDQSSLEKHPLGRTEWIRLYGALLDEEEKADALFSQQVSYMKEVSADESAEKTVAFFYINSSGFVVARKTGDYVTEMIELAGGKYIFDNLGDPEKNTSTVTLEMETFFAEAKDADYIIYNSVTNGEIENLEEFLSQNGLLKNFKAVQNRNVWCTKKNMFQETMHLGQMIQDFNTMLTNTDSSLTELEYLYKLQ